jgi:phage tail sheath protein FI
MPTYLSPGVYVQEVSSGSKPIEGVGTAVAAFVGLTEKGPANTPTLVTNWTQFNTQFGDFVEGSYLAHAVYGYFLNGGGSAYVVRVGSDGDGEQPSARAELAAKDEPGRPVYRITAAEGGPAGDDISVEIGDPGEAGEDTFKVTVSRGGKVEETFDNLSTKRGSNNASTVVKARSKLIRLEEIGSGGTVTVPEKASVKLSGGTSVTQVRVTADDYVGNSAT